MKQSDVYVDLDSNVISLASLDAEERKLVVRLRRQARLNADWDTFDNLCYKAVGDFYDSRGVSRAKSRHSVPFRIAQDLSGRLAAITMIKAAHKSHSPVYPR